MTWAKLDDTFIDDPRLLALPRGVRLLFVESIVWSCKHLTDGQIPAHVVSRITDEPEVAKAVAQLVDGGFWLETDTGYAIADFLENQPSRDAVEKRREDDRARQDRSRRHRAGDHTLCTRGRFCPDGELPSSVSRRDTASDSSRESRHPDPTRPDPTFREGKVKGRADALAPLRSLGPPSKDGGSQTFAMPGAPTPPCPHGRQPTTCPNCNGTSAA